MGILQSIATPGSLLQFPLTRKCARIVFLYQNGGLGNQFFQYYAARIVAPSAVIIPMGFRELQLCLDSPIMAESPGLFIRVLRRSLANLGDKFTNNLALNLHLLGSILDSSCCPDSPFARQSPGLIPGIYIQTGFFQDPSYFTTLPFNHIPLRSAIVEYARQCLNDRFGLFGANPYFLHVRRGDYTYWPSNQEPAVLPLKWYVSQMDHVRRCDPSAHFIAFSDDHAYLEDTLAHLPYLTIHRGSLIEDFAMMTQCRGGGILSASTFAWWAAWHGKTYSPSAKYIAPRFWAGWRRKCWYPPNIKTLWLEYVDVG